MSTPPVAEGDVAADVPTCYRHAGRETWIRCSRCDRPICPDCMRDASVGFQCPECVAEGQRGVRTPRTPYGGTLVRRAGAVTYTLIALNVVAFVAKCASAGTVSLYDSVAGPLDARFELISQAYYNGHVVGVATGEWYRLVTALFLHVSIVHIGFNMYLLALLGPPIEALVGRWRFLALYLLSGIGGSALSYLTDQGGEGASGAIFGLFAAFYVFSRRQRRDTAQITLLIVLNLAFSFAVPNVGYWAHIGGLVAGAVIAVALAYAPRGRHRLLMQGTGMAVVVVLTAGLVALHTAQLT